MRRFLMVLLGSLVFLSLPGAAHAATVQPRDDSLVVLSGDAYVAARDTVDSVVVFNGGVLVDGRVRDAVVAFSGPVTITGDVGGNVVVFDGLLTVQNGAHIGGDVFADRRAIASGATIDGSLSSTQRFAVAAGWASVVFGVAVWLAIALSILILGLLLLWFAPRAAESVVVAGKTAVGPSIGWGAAAVVGLPVLGVIAIATVVGIPFGIGILLALALIFAIGQTTGAWFLGRSIITSGSRVGAFALGWGILMLVGVIPAIGALVWLAATVYGLGMICVAAFRARRSPEKAVPVPTMPTQTQTPVNV
jgi:hypothetical protein